MELKHTGKSAIQVAINMAKGDTCKSLIYISLVISFKKANLVNMLSLNSKLTMLITAELLLMITSSRTNSMINLIRVIFMNSHSINRFKSFNTLVKTFAMWHNSDTMYVAFQYFYAATLKLLKRNGVDLNVKLGNEHKTPLHLAVMEQDKAVLNYLLKVSITRINETDDQVRKTSPT